MKLKIRNISNSTKSYVFIGFILFLMIGIYFNHRINSESSIFSTEKLKSNNSSEENDMDTTIVLMILSTIGIIATVYRNPQWEKLKDLIKIYQKENTEEHESIVNVLKKLQFKYDLETTLQETIDGILEVTSGELSKFISDEGDLFKKFAEEVSNGGLYPSCAPTIIYRAKQLAEDSDKRAKQLGEEFAKLHKISQQTHTEIFTKGVQETLMDEFFNSKQKRFRLYCEQFLHSHLTDSVKNYMKINN